MPCTPSGISFQKENIILHFLENLNVDYARQQPASPEQYYPTWKLEVLQWMTYTILKRLWGQGDGLVSNTTSDTKPEDPSCIAETNTKSQMQWYTAVGPALLWQNRKAGTGERPKC